MSSPNGSWIMYEIDSSPSYTNGVMSTNLAERATPCGHNCGLEHTNPSCPACTSQHQKAGRRGGGVVKASRTLFRDSTSFTMSNRSSLVSHLLTLQEPNCLRRLLGRDRLSQSLSLRLRTESRAMANGLSVDLYARIVDHTTRSAHLTDEELARWPWCMELTCDHYAVVRGGGLQYDKTTQVPWVNQVETRQDQVLGYPAADFPRTRQDKTGRSRDFLATSQNKTRQVPPRSSTCPLRIRPDKTIEDMALRPFGNCLVLACFQLPPQTGGCI